MILHVLGENQFESLSISKSKRRFLKQTQSYNLYAYR